MCENLHIGGEVGQEVTEGAVVAVHAELHQEGAQHGEEAAPVVPAALQHRTAVCPQHCRQQQFSPGQHN